MAEVASTGMLHLGASAPDFILPDSAGRLFSLSDVCGPKGVVVAFLCNHCPYVIHLAEALAGFADCCVAKGIGFVAINSNDVTRYPADSPERMKETAKKYSWSFPYLHDESQDVAKAYCAACTPDFYLFDANRSLVYCGQFDSSRPGRPVPVIGSDLHQAITGLLAGESPVANQHPSAGCNIKWKPGNEPTWYPIG